MTRTGWTRIVALGVGTVLAGCDGLLVDPAEAPPVALQVVMDPGAEALAPVVELIDRALVRLNIPDEPGGRFIAVERADGMVRARLLLTHAQAVDRIDLEVQLLSPFGALFAGSAQLQPLRSSGLEARVDVHPVNLSISPPFTALPIRSLGTPLEPKSVVRFASGDRLPGAEIVWTSRDPEVMAPTADGRLIPRGNGQARLIATVGVTEALHVIKVRQGVADFVGVAPADTVVDVDRTYTLRPLGLDVGGAPLLPGADVVWRVVEGPATVDYGGLVTARAPGEVILSGTAAGVRFDVRLTIQ